jgi:hypothetical protein
MKYSHSTKNESLGFPPAQKEDGRSADTLQMPLFELPLNHQIDQALAVIGKRHPQIARAIDAFWGFKEGEDYITKLIFDGSDPKSFEREGFKPDVVGALLTLQSIHKVARR